MNSVRQPGGLRAASVLALSLAIGAGAYAGRVWWHREGAESAAQSVTAPLAQLPRPSRPSAREVAEARIPHAVAGYQLVSVVPASKGHDLHALYESSHHVSLFVRAIVPHPGTATARDVGRYWLAAEPLRGYPAFSRTDVRHRAALAWIARGQRHVVTGDVPLEQLRAFALAYEEARPR